MLIKTTFLLLFVFSALFSVQTLVALTKKNNQQSNQSINQAPSNGEVIGTTTVSVYMPDDRLPSSPILIAPGNHSVITTLRPHFVWLGSTDDRQMDHHELYLNDELLFDNIPLVSSTTDQFSLEVIDESDRFSLLPSSILSNGTYSWKVRGVDLAGNYADSATWVFTINISFFVYLITEIKEGLAPPWSLTELAKLIPADIKKTIAYLFATLMSVLNLLLALSPPLLATIALASRFGRDLSLGTLTKILQALGLLPRGPVQGMVFNSHTNQGVPYTLVTIKGQDKNLAYYTDFALTDHRGIFRGLKTPAGSYRLSVRQPGYLFPTNQPRSPRLTLEDYYMGEVYTVPETENRPFLLVPLTLTNPDADTTLMRRLRVLLGYINSMPLVILLPLWLVIATITTFFPTAINWIVFAAYSVVLSKKIYQKLRTTKTEGIVINQNGLPIKDAIVLLTPFDLGSSCSVTTTSSKGVFKFKLKPGMYRLDSVMAQHTWLENNLAISSALIWSGKEHQQVVIMMYHIEAKSEIFDTIICRLMLSNPTSATTSSLPGLKSQTKLEQ